MVHSNEQPPKRDVPWVGALAAGAMVLLVVFAFGCEKPIFTRDEPVSQFDRLQKVRNTSEPAYIPDEFGNLRPNLTGRLSNLK